MIKKYTISRDDGIYHAWPDVTLSASGKMVCVFSECTHHRDRSYTRLMLTDSADRGRTWTPKRPLTEGTAGRPYYYNCARISRLRDRRLVVIADRLNRAERGAVKHDMVNLLFFSDDDGATWSEPRPVPLLGIVPDKLLELDDGRWIVSAHHAGLERCLEQYLWYSDDRGRTWRGPVTVARQPGLNLCEGSILPLNGCLVAFLRENSDLGLDCRKAVSYDGGVTWGEACSFPLPGCHRPVAGRLLDGRVLITYRFRHGGRSVWGMQGHNFFAGLADPEACLAQSRQEASVRIMPLDYDRAPAADTGYSGWVQFDDGEIYIVNYIVDDAPKGQIRGYALRPDDFVSSATV